MNFRLLSRQLGLIAFLIGATMIVSLPWAWPGIGHRGVDVSTEQQSPIEVGEFEQAGFLGLVGSIFVCAAVGGVLIWFGRGDSGRLYRKEAMAIVGLSWVLATVLGALPFLFSGTQRDVGQRMSIVDALFESQSGFSTTGATVLSKLEQPELVPHCILFWRSSTHFLGGLGIIVLFVVILGQGSAGKALMRAEMPGPTKEGATARMQHTAWLFAGIYCGLNLILAIILLAFGMSLFDAFCHAFGTMATGGFSTYDKSVGKFDSAGIDYVIIVFMVMAGTNFTLLYYFLVLKPARLFADVEWKTYIFIILVVTILAVGFGLFHGDFKKNPSDPFDGDEVFSSIRYGLFQVVSIITTTGYGTHDFDGWNSFGRGVLFLAHVRRRLAGSTGGGMKVIRHILFLKIMRLEIEQAYHPTVVRPLRLGGNPVEDPDLRKNILVYFGLILVIFVFSWLFIVTVEPDSTWRANHENKLIDSASGVAATLNNIGPGLGTVGATQNYGHFSTLTKLLFVFLMMVGRLEIFAILVLFSPSFWRNR